MQLEKNIEEKQEGQSDIHSAEIKTLEDSLRAKDQELEHLKQLYEHEKHQLAQEMYENSF